MIGQSWDVIIRTMLVQTDIKTLIGFVKDRDENFRRVSHKTNELHLNHYIIYPSLKQASLLVYTSDQHALHLQFLLTT